MCGICGIVSTDGQRIEAEDLQRMAAVLRHRGPDDKGQLICGSVALGFRRLSIIDIAGGHQPMSNEDGSAWIVFNGEIYNHPELRAALLQRDHRYTTHSDTEMILHLYEEYGEECVHHLRGMFAFAIWDRARNVLFCARDRLGIKPFYYSATAGGFAFASEIKGLLQLPCCPPRLNRRALPEFLAFGYLSSEETLFEGIYKLLPGHRLRLDLKQPGSMPEITRYWDLDITPPDNLLSEAEYVERFRARFREAVNLHLRSDVPLGVFLSGGLDSSAIAATVAELRHDTIETFSVGYAEDSYSELPYARQVAKHIGATHNEVILGPNEFFNTLPLLIWHEDEPLAWPSSVALYYVARLARQKVKVVLTGEGGDEMFAGYLKYRVTLWNSRYGPTYRRLVPQPLQELIRNALNSTVLPDWVQRKLRHSFLYYSDQFEKLYFDNFFCAFSQQEQQKFFAGRLTEELHDGDPYQNCMRFFDRGAGNHNRLARLLYLDAKTYLVELLMKQDQMSMAASLESRVPFLDHELVEWLARVPAHYKVRGFSGKYLLRKAFEGQLPTQIIRRHKKGFPTPIRPWLRNQLSDRLCSVLTDGRMADRELIRPEYVRTLLEKHRCGVAQATEACWRLLTFELWSRIFLDGERNALDVSAGEHCGALLCA